MSSNDTSVGEFIATTCVSYLTTNINDLIILLNFFTEVKITNSLMEIHHIAIDRYLSFIILVGVSLVDYGVSYVLPVKILSFLGFLSIILEIKGPTSDL